MFLPFHPVGLPDRGQTVFQNDNYYSGVGNTTFVDVFMIANGTNYPFSDGVWVPTSTVNYTSYLNLSFLPSFYQQNQFPMML